MKKTKVYHLIILDKSGSMERLRRSAVDGFNELADRICHLQAEHSTTQEHNVSLVVFSGQGTYIFYDEVPADSVRRLHTEDYRPYGMTPLYDAVGMALSRTDDHVAKEDDAVVIVTIITDGIENASREYTLDSIRRLICHLGEKGWAFTLFGTNQDAQRTAKAMGIRNACNFTYDEQGISEVFAFTCRVTTRISNNLDCIKHEESCSCLQLNAGERKRKYSLLANDAFIEEQSNA